MSLISSSGRVRSAVSSRVEHDAALYRDIARRMPRGLPPTAFMLRYVGPEARDLFDRYAAPSDWSGFRAAVAARYPDVPAWTPTVAQDGTRLASVPERMVYELLRPRLPCDITLVLHPRLPVPGRRFDADFGLSGRSGPVLHVEVTGAVARNIAPELEHEHRMARRLAAKLEACAKAGLGAPVILYADDFGDRARLESGLDHLITAAREMVL